MCRNIKTLFNFDPPVTDDEIRAASLQFVRKISGFNKPIQGQREAVRSRGGRNRRRFGPFSAFARNECPAEES